MRSVFRYATSRSAFGLFVSAYLLSSPIDGMADSTVYPDRDSVKFGQAVKMGHHLTWNQDLNRAFGAKGSFYLQGGKMIDANRLQDGPKCLITAHHPMEERLNRAVFFKGQDMLLTETNFKSAGVQLLGFQLGSGGTLRFTAAGNLLDSTGLGVNDPTKMNIIELQPLSFSLTFECSDFDPEPSLADVKATIEGSLISIVENAKDFDPFSLARETRAYREAEKRKIDEENNAIRLAEEALQKKISALGTKTPQNIPLSSLGSESSIRILKEDIWVETSDRFVGSIYQKSEKIGVFNAALDLYSVDGKAIDQKQPFCMISATKYRKTPASQRILLPAGIYSIVSAKKAPLISGWMIRIQNSSSEAQGEGTFEADVLCYHVNTLADVIGSIDPSAELYQKTLPNAISALPAMSEATEKPAAPDTVSPAGELSKKLHSQGAGND